MDQIVVYDDAGNAIGTKNDDLREKFILDQIELLKDNLKVLENATEQYKILFEQGVQDPATVIQYFEEKLPNLDKEYIRAFAPKILEKFIADVKAEEAKVAADSSKYLSVVSPDPLNAKKARELIKRLVNYKPTSPETDWRKWHPSVKIAKMREITGGYSWEQLLEGVEKNWISPEKLDQLFNTPYGLDD